MLLQKTEFIYDLETYPNIFLLGLQNFETKATSVIEISERNPSGVQHFYNAFVKLRQGRAILTGFNNLGFDYPILELAFKAIQRNPNISPLEVTKLTCDKAGEIISDGNKANRLPDEYGHLKIKHTIWQPLIDQRDLFKIHHFDGKGKTTSLKNLEFNMRMERVESLPVKPNTWCSNEQMDILVKYLREGDLPATHKFRVISQANVAMRDIYTKKYDEDFCNYNDTKIGKSYVINQLEAAGVATHFYDEDAGKRKPLQTHYKEMPLDKVIFPHVKFRSKELQALLEYLKGHTLTKTKDAFLDIPTSELGELNKYLHRGKGGKVKREIKEGGKLIPKPERIKGLHCLYEGFRFDFGTGGLHGSKSGVSIRSDADYGILDIDVTSFYPSLITEYGLFPAHLSPVFVAVYRRMLKARLSYAKGTPENAILKLALNGTYGNLINAFDCLYDPMMAMRVTINGQLLLTMLAESLMIEFGVEMIQANTDGLSFKYNRKDAAGIKALVDSWERTSRMKMEYAQYQSMHIKDVNNYIAEYAMSGNGKKNGKLKLVGSYNYKVAQAGMWHKNFSNLISKRAAVEKMVNGTPLSDTILSHDDQYDFMLRAKVAGSDVLKLGDKEIMNGSRFYASTDGEALSKIMPPHPRAKVKGVYRHSVLPPMGGYKSNIVNQSYESHDYSNVDYQFYYDQAEKLVL